MTGLSMITPLGSWTGSDIRVSISGSANGRNRWRYKSRQKEGKTTTGVTKEKIFTH